MKTQRYMGHDCSIPNPFDINARRDVDLDYPGYDVSKALDAHVASLGIKYLHVTQTENADSIRTGGLRSDDEFIYFVETALVLANIALTQVFIKEFHLFGLSDDRSLKFVPDEVGESISGHQWICLSNLIPPDRLVDLGAWRAALPLDQFVPFRPMVIDEVPIMAGLSEAERGKPLAGRERGYWPTGVLAYLERIDDHEVECGKYGSAGTPDPDGLQLQGPGCQATKDRLRKRAKNLMMEALWRLQEERKLNKRYAERAAGEVTDQLRREFPGIAVENYVRPAFLKAVLEG